MNPDLAALREADNAMLRVAMCQVGTEAWDVQGNVRRTLEALDEAGRMRAELAITPECVFHGYGFGDDADDTRRRCARIAEPLDGPNLAAVKQSAKRHGMWVMVGFVEAGAAGVMHNSVVVISPAGVIVDVYRKVHCRTGESADHGGPFTPGDRFVCTDLQLSHLPCHVGTMICFDREVPESTRCLRAMGAQVVACPMAWDTQSLDVHVDYAHNEMITRCRAAENEVFFVVVNHAGRFNGGSFAVGPGGACLLQMDDRPQVAVVELDVTTLRTKIHTNPHGWMGWGFRRQDVYDRHLPANRVENA